ncbi:MAG: hypothetical protein IT430_04050 [Phycisphaerales bacterium]|nr:hypothetical protein [Phycisphaerales bacterium]
MTKIEQWARHVLAMLALTAAGPVSAQLMFATDRFDGPQYLIDVENDRSFQVLSPWLYGAGGAWGMTADNDLGLIYYCSDEGLFSVSAETLRPSYLGVIEFDGEPISMLGLAWDSDAGILYGIAEAPQSALYQIDLTTREAALVMPLNPDFHFGGIDYDGLTKSLLGLADGTGAEGGALYRIDPVELELEFLTIYPQQHILDLDGLAAGDGRAYFVSDRNEPIYVYDLVAGVFLDPLTTPVQRLNVMCGAAWAPSFMDRLLVSEPNPGLVGRSNRFHVVGAAPMSTVHLLLSRSLGATGLPGCSGSVIELAGPRIIGSAMTDADGVARIGIYVPTQAFDIPVLLQLVDPANCEVSNLTFFTFGPE